MSLTWMGLDVGGANLKAADSRGFARIHPFPLWKDPRRLPHALRELLADRHDESPIAVTLTGELADCFADKAEGVTTILLSVREAFEHRTIRCYSLSGEFLDLDTALTHPTSFAAANWHALATYAGRCIPSGKNGILVDIGSTTTDLVVTDSTGSQARDNSGHQFSTGSRLSGGTLPVRPQSATDLQRLLAGQLVYTGVQRTPICGIVRTVPYRGSWCPVAAEWFATTRDVYLVLGDLPERPQDHDTADGRPANVDHAVMRLARMVCADSAEFTATDAAILASHVAACQARTIAEQLQRQVERFAAETAILAGAGEFLARRVLESIGWRGNVVSLEQQLGAEVSVCATAYALAVLADERTSEEVPPEVLWQENAARRSGDSGPWRHTAQGGPERLAGSLSPGPARRLQPIRVVKLGGSLFDTPELVERFLAWTDSNPSLATVVIVGGGATVEAIREQQRQLGFSDAAAHELALAGMSLNTRAFLAALERHGRRDFRLWRAAVPESLAGNLLLDVSPWPWPHRFPLQENWSVTSDSIAAVVARVVGAEELVLLKSRLPQGSILDAELVDPCFPSHAAGIPQLRLVNLRAERFPECRLVAARNGLECEVHATT